MKALLILLALAAVAHGSPRREGKALSIFNVVQFKNEMCQTELMGESLCGTCFSAGECESKGGKAGGSCAQGFGVCCIFKAACDEDIVYNNTYVKNEDYPSASTAEESCTWNVKRMQDDICFIRIDFETSELANVETDPIGNCNVDKIEFTSGNEEPTNTICGQNNGAHMYIPAGSGDNAKDVQIIQTLTGEADMRKYHYKVSQIACGQDWTPRPGCTQWFDELSGNIRSYNRGGQQILDNQDVTYCIRQNAGFCRVGYMARGGNSLSTVLNPDQNNGDNKKSSNTCQEDYIIIPQGRNRELGPGNTDNAACVYNGRNRQVDTRDRYCGNRLSCRSSDETNREVISMANGAAAFTARFISDDVTPTLSGHNGHNLNFRQIPC